MHINIEKDEDSDMNNQRMKNYLEKGIYGTDTELRASNATLKLFVKMFLTLCVVSLLAYLSK